MSNDFFLPASKQIDLDIDSAKGTYLFDKNGMGYLDFFSGMGVNALGHQHPKIQKAIERQMKRNLHLFGYFLQDVHHKLAELALQNTHFGRIFLTNSGTESVEGALKLVKKWANQNKRKDIVCFNGGFHGRSLGALSVTAQKAKQAAFQPLLNNIKAINKTEFDLDVTINEDTAAVIIELVVGEGGIHITDSEFVEHLMRLKKRYGFLLIVDEIQSGMGRTGELFSYMHYNIEPDIIAVAKAIGGGLPLGAFMLTEELANVFAPGEHGSTFGGNPLACATGIVVLEELMENKLLDNVNTMSNYFFSKLAIIKAKYPTIITEVRGIGLMIGIEMGDYAAPVMKKCLENFMIVNVTQGTVIRLLPPLVVTRLDIDKALEILEKSIVESQV